YLFWKRGEQPSWLSDFSTGLALGAAMTVKFSGALLPIVLAGFCLVRKQIKSLFIMAAACLLVIEAAYLFSSSPLLYFRNMGFVNANHLKTYPSYLFGELKPAGWWHYFLVAFASKATLPAGICAAAPAVEPSRR